MIGQAAWEKKLRRSLRSKSKPAASTHQPDAKDTIATVLLGAALVAIFSIAADGDRDRLTAVSVVTGVYGILLGQVLRARWQDGMWLAPYAPVDATAMRKLETRGAMPDLIRVFLMGLAMASLGCLPGWPHAPLKAMPVAAASMLMGMMFSSGRWGKTLLVISGIAATAWAFLGIGSAKFDTGSLSYGFLHGWLPAYPLSLWIGDASLAMPRFAVFAAAFMTVLWEWRKVWQIPDTISPPEVRNDEGADDSIEQDTVVDPLPEPEDMRPALRDEVRATVTRHWMGFVAYLDSSQFTWMDRWIWKRSTPRQRMITCLGIHETRSWLRQVVLSGMLLAVAVVLAWLLRFSMAGALGPAMTSYGILLGLPALGLMLFAFAASFPGSKSSFGPWTRPFNPGLHRSISPLAVFPVVPDEWAHCAAREWLVRACLVASLWSIAIATAALAFMDHPSLRAVLGCILSPWLLFAAMLPFSVGSRLLRAHFGKTQEFTLGLRILLSLSLMVTSPAAVIVGMVGFALEHFPTFCGGLSIAAITGWLGLRLAIASCGNMRADAAFDTSGESKTK